MNPSRRIGFLFLCGAPFLIAAAASIRDLRVPAIHRSIGVVLFTGVCVAAWLLGARAIRWRANDSRELATAGSLLLLPFALVGLLWVGLGTPWQATPVENVMRYLVLLAGSVSVAGSFVLLTEVLQRAGERYFSTLGFAANMLGGSAYLVWVSFELGARVTILQMGEASPMVSAIGSVTDALLFSACILTYAITAAFATSFERVGWLSRRAATGYISISLVAISFLTLRGLTFPNPTADAVSWYVQPAFIVGIPAVPWIMPFLLGLVVLRRAGDLEASNASTSRESFRGHRG